jgi:hypothetical protein
MSLDHKFAFPPFRKTVSQWEEYNHEQLSALYDKFFNNEKFDCTYDDFVKFMYQQNHHKASK